MIRLIKVALFISTCLLLYAASQIVKYSVAHADEPELPELVLDTSDDGNDWIPDNGAVSEAREDGQGPTPTPKPRPKVKRKTKGDRV